MSQEQNIWGRGQRRDGSSEWPSTGFSTLNGEPTPRRRRRRKPRYLGVAMPLLVALSGGGIGVWLFARLLHG